MAETAGTHFDRLLEIMRALRAPGGCPWDREQTLASLRPFVLEETYEVLEAIENGSAADLREELGDYLYEAVFLAQISEESGDFSIADAIEAVCDKLVRRHPHVFARQAGDEAMTPGEVVERWEVMKARERAARVETDETDAGVRPQNDSSPGSDPSRTSTSRKTTLGGVPRTLPALLRAYEISSRAAAVGFDWTRAEDVLDKIDEEVAEVRHEVETGATGHLSRAEDEMGDLLFAIANLSRKLGIEPEAALRRAHEKFTRRFDALERSFAQQGRALQDATDRKSVV